MKTKLAVFPLIALLLFAAGCATFLDNGGKSLATVVQTVDLGMKGWAAYVATGKSNPQQEAIVRSAYAKYQLAEAAAERAYLAVAMGGNQDSFSLAEAALKGAQADLLALLQSFQGKGNP